MHELGHTLCQWLKARTLMIRFHGLVALALTLALLTGSLPASAASADPLPETNDAVRDAAVEEPLLPDTDEPIVVALDLPPELQTFLAEQEASRLAEAAALEQADETTQEAAPQNAQTDPPQSLTTALSEPTPNAVVDAQEPEQSPLDELPFQSCFTPNAVADAQKPEQSPLDELPFQSCFTAAASTYNVEESLLIGIAIVESSMDPDAVSSSNAIGLMQIKWPITGNHLGISDRQDLFDPCTNIDAGARYLRELLDDLASFAPQPRKRLALASYRLGPNGFDPNIPLPTTAQDYIEKIESQQRALSEPLSSDQTATTAGPVLPCLIQNLRKLASITHDPSQRSAQVGQWIDARGAGCSALALIQIRNNLPVWLGTALTAERVRQVQRLLDEAINTPPKEGGRPTPGPRRG